MSRVFLAVETALGRQVVVKILPPELPAAFSADRFKREIGVAARLQHPHIVPLLSAGEMDGVPWFTMPFVEGESLRARLNRRGELPVSEATRILREIASALAYAHEHGLVHRDIKPDNVLISGDVAMVADFGVAKAITAAARDQGVVTSLGVALGTPGYMAPEQAAADPSLDHRADLYAFGVLAYEILTGAPPFFGRSPSQLLAAHVAEVPEPISHRRPQLPPALAALVMRCLEKRPADRPQTATEIVHTLDEIATPGGGTLPVSIAVGPAPAAAGRRFRPGLAMAALVVMALGAAAWWSLRGRNRAVTSADAASHRIAVLPFDNLGDSADAYFADGLTDAVRGQLTELNGIEVIARPSSIQYRLATTPAGQIARDLGVRYLLTGTVRWAKSAGTEASRSRVQVRPELIEVVGAGAPKSRWQQPFDAELSDVFRVQGEIATRVIGAMSLALGSDDRVRASRQRRVEPAAYDAFLRAEAAWNGGLKVDPASLRSAIELYQQALRDDFSIVEAWPQLSRAYGLLYANNAPTRELRRKAEEFVDRVKAADSTDPRARQTAGHFYRLIARDYPRATQEYEAALRRSPGDGTVLGDLANTQYLMGRNEESIRNYQTAVVLNPRSSNVFATLSRALLQVRRYPEAAAAADRAISLSPVTMFPRQIRMMAELAQGNLPAARRVIADAARELGPEPVATYVAQRWETGWALDSALEQRVLDAGPEALDNDRATWGIIKTLQYHWRGDLARAKRWADTARVHFPAQIADAPDNAQLYSFYGLALAYLGNRSEAVAQGKRGIALAPREVDAVTGLYGELLLARIYLVLGEQDKALDLIEGIMAQPYYLSPAWLRLDPTYAPLKGNPRFEKLIAGG